jgi:DNA-binding response OmpR family regulator
MEAAKEGAAFKSMNKQRILVVDDEPKVSDLVRMFLERTKRFEVRVENRSANAMTAVREFRPDMVLLDVDMPGKDGGVVASEIKAQPATQKLPILFLTSLVSRAEAGERETVRGGMRFLAKPLDPKVLIETVDRILSEPAAAA